MHNNLLNKLPFEIMYKIHFMCLPSIFDSNQFLKNDIINHVKMFYNIKTRIYYIKKHKKFLIKQRIKKRISELTKLTKNNSKK